jgi:AraC family transcriptional regulator
MYEHYDEPLTLTHLARIACLSPYHFNRVFREVTGVPPRRFLTVLRMHTAKRLLLTTSLRVTDVCLDVGYRSLGTFTTHFRQLVGVGPVELRRLAALFGSVPLRALATSSMPEARAPTLRIRLGRTEERDRPAVAFTGLFPTPSPQSRPSGCAVVELPATPVVLAAPQSGSYYALASAYDAGDDVLGALLAGRNDVLLGVAGPVQLTRTAVVGAHVRLRRPVITDPPILLALPLVLAKTAGGDAAPAGDVRRAVANA